MRHRYAESGHDRIDMNDEPEDDRTVVVVLAWLLVWLLAWLLAAPSGEPPDWAALMASTRSGASASSAVCAPIANTAAVCSRFAAITG